MENSIILWNGGIKSISNIQYIVLSSVALKVLAIPATSAPSERVFSVVAGLTILKERSKLDAAHAGGAYIFT